MNSSTDLYTTYLQCLSLYQLYIEKEGDGINLPSPSNILKNYIFLIWRYKGLYILKSDNSVIKDYLDYDVYDNTVSALVDRYYVTAVTSPEGKVTEFKALARFDSEVEVDYYRNGGILQMVLRAKAQEA